MGFSALHKYPPGPIYVIKINYGTIVSQSLLISHRMRPLPSVPGSHLPPPQITPRAQASCSSACPENWSARPLDPSSIPSPSSSAVSP